MAHSGRRLSPVTFVYGARDPYAPAPAAPTTTTARTCMTQSSTSTSDTSSSSGTSSDTGPVPMSSAKGGTGKGSDKSGQPDRPPTQPAAAPAPIRGSSSHPAPPRDSNPGSGHPTGMNDDPDPDTRPLDTRQQLLRTSGPDLLYSEHPRTAVGFNAALGLRVDADVLVVVPLAGEPALVHDPRITWDVLCTGALAKYTVSQHLDDGGVIATSPRPLSEHYTNINWALHFVLEPPTPTSLIIMDHGSHSALGNDRTDNRRRAHTISPEASSDSEAESGSDSDGSQSDAGNDATTTFRDAAHRRIKRVKGSSMQLIRASEPLRAFATPARVDALLASVGNEINNYSAVNFTAGATDIYIKRQVSSGAADRDPSWYNLPPFYDLVWWVQRETNSGITSQIVYGT
ncbi:hypothetical protein B484DRAFT_405087 [Ochromonadaceae sp. CCMP2298]|nr:hypothetical protein B484DRAFT_405087 [Ochromonadaceae sp. CCMP2298]